MIPAEFFAPMDDVDTPYRELREKMRTMNEEDLEKVSTFIGWIENKNRISKMKDFNLDAYGCSGFFFSMEAFRMNK